MIRLSETGLFGPCMAASGRWRRACGGGLVVAGCFAVPADAQELPDLHANCGKCVSTTTPS
jgi:hypothetical protein